MDRVLYIVNAEHEAGTYIPPHQHECFELVYYIHGQGTCSIGQRSYHFRPSSFALIRQASSMMRIISPARRCCSSAFTAAIR